MFLTSGVDTKEVNVPEHIYQENYTTSKKVYTTCGTSSLIGTHNERENLQNK